jgi:hypothetical protein
MATAEQVFEEAYQFLHNRPPFNALELLLTCTLRNPWPESSRDCFETESNPFHTMQVAYQFALHLSNWNSVDPCLCPQVVVTFQGHCRDEGTSLSSAYNGILLQW